MASTEDDRALPFVARAAKRLRRGGKMGAVLRETLDNGGIQDQVNMQVLCQERTQLRQ